jgi:methylmalonyl-CoA/ethylmalonyl-CoA epimerase
MPAAAPSASGATLDAIGQIAINAKDLPRAVAFYRDTLRLPFLFEAPPALAFFQCGTVRLMLTKAETPEFDHPSSIIYFTVADINAAAQGLTSRGVAFVEKPHVVHRTPQYELWMGSFRDTEGNLLALMTQRPL